MKKGFALLKKIITWASLVIIAALIIAAVITALVNKKSNSPTFIFGYAVMRVETGSMETAIPAKSYILVRKSDGKNLGVGTVVTYMCKDETSPVYGNLVTHRITVVEENGYVTKGDANPAADRLVVTEDAVVAVYVKNLPVFTFFGRVFASPIGLILIAATFIGACAFVYIPEIVHALRDDDKAENEKDAEIRRRIDEEVERLKQEDEKRRRDGE